MSKQQSQPLMMFNGYVIIRVFLTTDNSIENETIVGRLLLDTSSTKVLVLTKNLVDITVVYREIMTVEEDSDVSEDEEAGTRYYAVKFEDVIFAIQCS